MLANTPFTPAQYTKETTPGMSSDPMGAMPTGGRRAPKKLFGMDRRSLLVALGLTSFLILTMAAVFIALNQRFRKETVAPTAPTQSSASIGNKCSLTFTVPQINTPVKSSHVSLTCSATTGYVCDPDAPTRTYDIKIYEGGSNEDGGTLVATVKADQTLDASLSTACGGNAAHSFTYTLPTNLVDGEEHTYYAYWVRPSDGSLHLLNDSPRSFDTATCFSAGVACEEKATYQNEFSNTPGNYQLLTKKSIFQPGDIVVYAIKAKNNGQLAVNLTITDPATGTSLNQYLTFMDSNCTGAALGTSNMFVCNVTGVPAGGSVTKIFRAKISESAPNGVSITNSAKVGNSGETKNCSATIVVNKPGTTPSPTPTPTPGVTPTPTPSPTPVVTPAPGCNDTCTSNADCSNSNHICFNNKCRLESNANSSTCSPAVTSTPTTQPVLPEELPQSGVLEDTLQMVGLGGAAIVIGAILLFLL